MLLGGIRIAFLSSALLISTFCAGSVVSAGEPRALLESVFPPPLPGWTAADVEVERPPLATLGGTLGASRRYERDKARIDIRLDLSSPWSRQLRIILDNPELVTADGEIAEMAGQPALISRTRRGIRIVVVRGAAVVEVEQQGDVDSKAPYEYAAAVRYTVLDEIQEQEWKRRP